MLLLLSSILAFNLCKFNFINYAFFLYYLCLSWKYLFYPSFNGVQSASFLFTCKSIQETTLSEIWNSNVPVVVLSQFQNSTVPD